MFSLNAFNGRKSRQKCTHSSFLPLLASSLSCRSFSLLLSVFYFSVGFGDNSRTATVNSIRDGSFIIEYFPIKSISSSHLKCRQNHFAGSIFHSKHCIFLWVGCSTLSLSFSRTHTHSLCEPAKLIRTVAFAHAPTHLCRNAHIHPYARIHTRTHTNAFITALTVTCIGRHTSCEKCSIKHQSRSTGEIQFR